MSEAWVGRSSGQGAEECVGGTATGSEACAIQGAWAK